MLLWEKSYYDSIIPNCTFSNVYGKSCSLVRCKGEVSHNSKSSTLTVIVKRNML